MQKFTGSRKSNVLAHRRRIDGVAAAACVEAASVCARQAELPTDKAILEATGDAEPNLVVIINHTCRC